MSETLNQRKPPMHGLLKRNVFQGVGNYRFGFSGKERDNEIQGDGNAYDFGARIYDSRLGRWLSLDPLQAKYPHLNPYNFCANNPIMFIDPDAMKIFKFKNGRLILKTGFLFIPWAFKAYLKNPNMNQLQKDMMIAMREAIKTPETVKVYVEPNSDNFDIPFKHTTNIVIGQDKFGENIYRIDSYIKHLTYNVAGGEIDPSGDMNFYTILINDERAKNEEYKGITSSGTEYSTGKVASAVFIHELLDEFLNFDIKKVINSSSGNKEKTTFMNKALLNKGEGERSDHIQ